eukprot:gene9548-10553_t
MSSKKRAVKRDHPDDVSIACDIYRKENIAIVLAYFSVGLVGSFLSTPLNIYLVEYLNAEPQMQNTIGILQTLPWSLKLAFGFLSDAVPMYGMHRKPYLAIGAVLYSTAFMAYAILGVHSVVFLSACTFMGTIGLIQMDVMADTMCVQRSKYEPEDTRGQMQASCYSIRFAGSLIGAICGATLCNRKSWGWGLDFMQLAFLNGLIPFILVTPSLFTLREKFHFSQAALDANTSSKKRSSDEGVGGEERKANEDPANADERSHLLEMGTISSSTTTNKPFDHGYGATAKTNAPSTTNVNDGANGGDASQHPHYHHHHKKIVIDEDSRLVPDLHMTAAGYHGFGHVEILTEASNSDSEPSQEEEDVHVDDDDVPKSIYEQLDEIWQTVQLQSVWRPMAFVYIFNLFQVPNVAWQSYLQLNLQFPAWILGMTVILGSFMTFAGVMAYKYFFFKTSWRRIYVWTVSLTCFFSMLQLILIFQWNVKYLHLNNYFFSLGDDVISAYISGIQFLPLCIMYMRLCPEGAEGASYAMLTTFGNIALVCASNLGNLLSNVWDVSNDAMRSHNVDGLWKLNTLTSCLSVLPLSLLFLLPRSPEEQEELAKSQIRSKTAGIIFLTVLFGSLCWTVVTALTRLMD